MNNWPSWSKVLIIVLAVMACLGVCCCIVAAGAYFYLQDSGGISTIATQIGVIQTTEPTPEIIWETAPAESTLESATPGSEHGQATPVPVGDASAGAWETLKTLEQAQIPVNDLRELAVRLGGKPSPMPESVPAPSTPLKVGDTQKFWVSNTDTDENFQVTATLRKIGEHVYFWVENGVRYRDSEIKALVDAFDQKIYPTDRNFFGSENTPGVDNDPRLYILYASGLGSSLAGYYSSADAVVPQAHPYSNAHEMFVLSADNAPLSDEYTFGVLAHEFQHMIHWYQDRNEESWLNEGFSELASFLNHYDVGSAAYSFASDPDLQLNTWPDPSQSYEHYGSSYLFVAYVLDRFGSDFTKALVKDPQNGMDSLDDILKAQNIINPKTGSPMTADEVFADWTVANLLNDKNIEKGQYAYTGGEDVPGFYPRQSHSSCPVTWQNATVTQYGTDYIEFDCPGSYELQFQGVSEVGVIPEDAYSGDYAFWSNRGDESDMTLTRAFDFTNVQGSFSLNYKVWYELEKGYDYVYLTASTDGGSTWQILQTPDSTDYNPSGNSYGWGYNGSSNGWKDQTVDLSKFAGKKVLLRFEYITDAAVNENGLMLDDVSIDAIGYQTDFESDDGGWQAEGFVRLQNRLPQTFAVTIIEKGTTTKVTTTLLEEKPQFVIPITIGENVDSIVLVVSGTTRFTTQPAIYRYQLVQK